MSRHRTGLATALVAVLLAGCGASDAEQLASDACELFEQAFGDEPDMEALMEMQGDMQDLVERADEVDVADEEMQQAIRDECPDVMETMEGLAPDGSGAPEGS